MSFILEWTWNFLSSYWTDLDRELMIENLDDTLKKLEDIHKNMQQMKLQEVHWTLTEIEQCITSIDAVKYANDSELMQKHWETKELWWKVCKQCRNWEFEKTHKLILEATKTHGYLEEFQDKCQYNSHPCLMGCLAIDIHSLTKNKEMSNMLVCFNDSNTNAFEQNFYCFQCPENGIYKVELSIDHNPLNTVTSSLVGFHLFDNISDVKLFDTFKHTTDKKVTSGLVSHSFVGRKGQLLAIYCQENQPVIDVNKGGLKIYLIQSMYAT